MTAGFDRKPLDLEADQRLQLVVADNTEQYNRFSRKLGGDEKSSSFCAFSSAWMPAQAESLTAIYITHATVEQYIHLLVGPEPTDLPPRWFTDGVACYIGRWQKPNLFGWSRDRLKSVGGLPQLKRLANGYQPNEQHILTSGMVVSFLKSDSCPENLRNLFQQSVVALNDGRKVSKTLRKLEKSLIKNEKLVRKFADL